MVNVTKLLLQIITYLRCLMYTLVIMVYFIIYLFVHENMNLKDISNFSVFEKTMCHE